MADFQNFARLPVRAQASVRRMVEIRGLPLTDDNLAAEAYALRVRSGWFVWECPSTARACREKKLRIAVPEYEMPVFPDLCNE